MSIIHSLKCTVSFAFAVPLLSLLSLIAILVTLFHSLSFVVPLVVICCHLSLVVPLVVTRCHWLSLVVTLCTTLLSFYKRSKLNVFLIRFLSCLYTTRIWLNLITLKAFRSSCSQMFYKIGVLKNFAKFTGKHLCWSHFLIKLHTCFPMIFVESSLKIKQRFCLNKLAKVT